MTLQMDQAKKFLGKTIVDAHGRSIGRLVGIATDIKNTVTSVEIELGNSQFLHCPAEQLLVEGDSLIYLHEWKVQASDLKKELDIALRRVKALEELYKSGEIRADLYDDLKTQHESAVNELQTRRAASIDDLKNRKKRFDEQVKELETFLANNKMQHSSGEIGDEAYKIANESIHSGLERTLAERKDIESYIDYLSRLENKEPPKPTYIVSNERSENRDVVVVHIEESPA